MRSTAWMLLVVAALWAGLAERASADVFDDSIATTSRHEGEMYFFARGPNGDVLERHWAGGWSEWTSLGGVATSGPTAVAVGGRILVFVRGADGGVYQNTLDGNLWRGWGAIGGYATSAPSAAVRRGTGYIDLTVRGSDNAIWQQSYVPGQGWSGFANIGGNLTSAPTAVSQQDGVLNIFARGTDGAVAQRSWTGSAWTDWLSVGGGIVGAPASVSRSPGFLNLYVRGAANALYARVWTSAGWGEWTLLDSVPLDSAPMAGGDGPNHEWVVARGGDGMILKEWSAKEGWGAWRSTGPVAVPVAPTPPPAPPVTPAPEGEVNLITGLRCTPAGGRLRVSISVKKPKGKSKARVTKIVFYTKGKGRRVRTDRKAPFVVRIKINRPAGKEGRVYARVYYKRSARGKTHRKVVSRRYVVCR